MTGARVEGMGGSSGGSYLLMGTNSEIRGFIAGILIMGGVEPERLSKILAAGRSQLYADRKAALLKGMGGRHAGGPILSVVGDELDEDEDEEEAA